VGKMRDLRRLGLGRGRSVTAALLQDAPVEMILARAAELREDAIRNQGYRLTPLGRLVGLYLDDLRFNNYSGRTVDSREYILAGLAFDLANLAPNEVTTDRLRTYLNERYGELKPNTRHSAVSAVKCLFAWLHDNDHLPSDPARKLKAPRSVDSERKAHSLSTIRRIIVAQDARRDRCALLLLYWCALRRNELRQVQFRHIDLARRTLTVFGKGGKVAEQNIPEQVALELERYVQDEGLLTERGSAKEEFGVLQPAGHAPLLGNPPRSVSRSFLDEGVMPMRNPDLSLEGRSHAGKEAGGDVSVTGPRLAFRDEYLLYPQKLGRRGTYPHYTDQVIWEDRLSPLSMSGIDVWWRRMLRNAGLPQFPMHEVRHTAGTHFHEAGHDLYATQIFLRHASAATTARVYLHLDRTREVARVQRDMADPLEEEA
jgi:site-specific recombinase XerD